MENLLIHRFINVHFKNLHQKFNPFALPQTHVPYMLNAHKNLKNKIRKTNTTTITSLVQIMKTRKA